MEPKSWGYGNAEEKEKAEEQQEYERVAKEKHNEYLLHKVLAKLDWLEWNCHPPVNYPLIVIVSVVTSVITTFVITRL